VIAVVDETDNTINKHMVNKVKPWLKLLRSIFQPWVLNLPRLVYVTWYNHEMFTNLWSNHFYLHVSMPLLKLHQS